MTGAIGDDRGVNERPLIGRDAPLRELERARGAARPCVTALGRGRDRQDAARGGGRGAARDFRRAARRVHRVRRRGARLRAGRRAPAARRSPLDELPPRRDGALAAVLPRETPGTARRAAATSCCSTCSGGWRRRAPVLLVLEDIHWADRSTLALLAFLARNLREERIAVVATYRVDDALSPDAAAARGRAGRGGRSCCGSTLSRSRPTTSRASSRRSRARPCRPRWRGELHARAGGNPFFVEELFAARDGRRSTEAVLARVERLDAGGAGHARRGRRARVAHAARAPRRGSGRAARGARRRRARARAATASRSGTG